MWFYMLALSYSYGNVGVQYEYDKAKVHYHQLLLQGYPLILEKIFTYLSPNDPKFYYGICI